MNVHGRGLTSPKAKPRESRGRGLVQSIALGSLTLALLATATTPAIANREQPAGHHEQRQEQGVNGAGKHKGKKNKTVKKTFSSSEPMAIPTTSADREIGPADPYPTTVAVSGFKKGKIADVNLTLRGLTHTFPADLDVLVVAPNGRNALVVADVGRDPNGTAVTDITLNLDDEAATTLPSFQKLASGAFRPFATVDASLLEFPAPAPVPSENVALSTFDGGDPNGEWQLFIIDDGQGDAGFLDEGWELEITAKSKSKSKGRGKNPR